MARMGRPTRKRTRLQPAPRRGPGATRPGIDGDVGAAAGNSRIRIHPPCGAAAATPAVTSSAGFGTLTRPCRRIAARRGQTRPPHLRCPPQLWAGPQSHAGSCTTRHSTARSPTNSKRRKIRPLQQIDALACSSPRRAAAPCRCCAIPARRLDVDVRSRSHESACMRGSAQRASRRCAVDGHTPGIHRASGCFHGCRGPAAAAPGRADSTRVWPASQSTACCAHSGSQHCAKTQLQARATGAPRYNGQGDE